jgi:RNA 2',3'-cyclic 3'-phosphodiesterase
MRLFTGLELPGEVVGNLEELLRRLKPVAPLHWSPPANLHVTTKFIGEWPEEKLSALIDGLRTLPGRPPLPVRIRNVGFFPNPHSPRVFWCGVDAPGLPALASDTDRATAALGIEPERKPYSPHLTLARIKETSDLQPLRKVIAGLESLDFGSFAARSFFLYQSTLRPTGSVYTKLAEFPLEP